MLDKFSKEQLGFALVGLGAFFLLGNLGVFGFGDFLPALLFFGGSALFLRHFNNDRDEHWWALIPGFALLAITLAIVGGPFSGGLFLGTVGLGFVAVYLHNPRNWWAVIPGGVLLTLGLTAAPLLPFIDEGIIFFLGLTATFVTLYRLPEGKGRQKWARYPAFGTLALSIMIAFDELFGGFDNVLLSVALLVAGGYLLWQHYQGSSMPNNQRQSSQASVQPNQNQDTLSQDNPPAPNAG
jgi:hypothetical protein